MFRKFLNDRRREKIHKEQLTLAWPQLEELRRRAAGISSVTLICHQDTWQIVASELKAEQTSPTSPPEPVVDDAGMAKILLSGPVLVNVTSAMLIASIYQRDVNIRAIAERVYEGIAQVVGQIDPGGQEGTPVPDIVIDDTIGSSAAD